MPPTIPRPLSPDAIARLRSVAEVCEVLRGWGRSDLADRIAYFASDEDLDDGDAPVTLESALGFLALFGAVDSEGKVELACSPEGWISAEWYFDDARTATVRLLDYHRVMFAARRHDGDYTDLGIGGEYGDRLAVTEQLVAAGILKWHKTNQSVANSRPATT